MTFAALLRPATTSSWRTDLVKDPAVIEAAYNDAVASRRRSTATSCTSYRELGGDFDPDAFEHVAFFDAEAGRVEMHLEAITAQTVRLPGAPRAFAAGERIHTENSWKYAPEEFAALLTDAGFRRLRCWQDDARDFAVFYAA